MIQPFNDLQTLYAFTSYREGAGGSDNVGDSLQAATLDGTFSRSQLEGFLQRARNEIYSRCGQKTNDEYTEARRIQLSEAELYLTVARMYLVHAERTALKFPESNLAGVGEVTIGADTPSPYEKMSGWQANAKLYREYAEALMSGQGNAWTMAVGQEPVRDRFPCLGSCTNCQCQSEVCR